MDRTNKKNAAELYYPKSMRFRSNPYCTHKLVEQIYETLDWAMGSPNATVNQFTINSRYLARDQAPVVITQI